MRKRDLAFVFVCGFGVTALIPFYCFGRSAWIPAYKGPNKRTVEEVLTVYGPRAESRLRPFFEYVDIEYPPSRITLLAFKEEKRLEMWAQRREQWVFVKKYRVRAASGHAGPKLREGDRQVPEGVYEVVDLNPNSHYHLSMKLNYPNRFDLLHAAIDGRSNPGGNIFIHGRAVSTGCLAMGDAVAEELFVLMGRIGVENVKVILAPRDLRSNPIKSVSAKSPWWVPKLYREIAKELKTFERSNAYGDNTETLLTDATE